jgi:hypothetical protein
MASTITPAARHRQMAGTITPSTVNATSTIGAAISATASDRLKRMVLAESIAFPERQTWPPPASFGFDNLLT